VPNSPILIVIAVESASQRSISGMFLVMGTLKAI
jgi:hypothetical protein